ncbi:MAG TPA: Rrf2 family transcriptional regulator [Noviherbaspirillum sp.]|nr:Rrf2 family transcriptional regulator [Noviherbaspirillum sp.]
MGTVGDCILGSSVLHDRFFAITEILAKLVSSAPRSVSIPQLEDATGRNTRELTRLCSSLARAGLLRPDPRAPQKLQLTCDASQVTLEDVYRCVLSEQTRNKATARTCAKAAPPERVANDVDLLVTQAMIAINQSVFKHLRQFSLDRLKISAAGMFPERSRPLGNSCLDDAFDLAISGREAQLVSPVQMPA